MRSVASLAQLSCQLGQESLDPLLLNLLDGLPTPADPALALTSCHAFAKMSSRYILSYSAWNRRVGLTFAARYRARWSSRALSGVDLARRALTSAYLPQTRRSSAAPSLHERYPASS